MRAARWLWLVLLPACGGRTIGDSIYDEDGGAGQGGASSQGGRSGVSGGKSRGGAPASSGGKGNATSGGAIGMGGASVTPPESCRLFCRELVADCGVVLRLNDMVCRSTCVDGFNGRTGVCEQLRISALGCIQNALARPMASCDDMSRIISMDCVVPLTLAAACGR